MLAGAAASTLRWPLPMAVKLHLLPTQASLQGRWGVLTALVPPPPPEGMIQKTVAETTVPLRPGLRSQTPSPCHFLLDTEQLRLSAGTDHTQGHESQECDPRGPSWRLPPTSSLIIPSQFALLFKSV